MRLSALAKFPVESPEWDALNRTAELIGRSIILHEKSVILIGEAMELRRRSQELRDYWSNVARAEANLMNDHDLRLLMKA